MSSSLADGGSASFLTYLLHLTIAADVICKHGTGADVGVADKSWKFVGKVVNYFTLQVVTTQLQLINRFVYDRLTDVEYLTDFILSGCDGRR